MTSDLVLTSSNLPSPVATPQEWAARRQQFNDWANTQLRKGVDFGVIPSTDKPTLLKPGAEKIAQLFGCAPELDEIHRDQDPNTGYLYIEYRCRLVNLQTGQVLAHGVGACSSWESKYRWRWEWFNGNGNPPDGEGWEQGKAKSGRTYWRRRIENRDLIDQWNTVLKMAKKRALVDAALTVSGASEKFTQDLEDMPDFQGEPDAVPASQPAPAPQPAPPVVVTAETKEPPKAPPVTTGIARPARPHVVQGWLRTTAQQLAARGTTATDGQRGAMCGAVEALFENDQQIVRVEKRHSLLRYFWGVDSSAKLTPSQIVATASWAQEKLDTGEYAPDANAVQEAAKIIEQDLLANKGQLPPRETERDNAPPMGTRTGDAPKGLGAPGLPL